MPRRESAGEKVVKDAHLKMMRANHPDAGGSAFVAIKINEAKDLLLRGGSSSSRQSGGSPFG